MTGAGGGSAAAAVAAAAAAGAPAALPAHIMARPTVAALVRQAPPR